MKAGLDVRQFRDEILRPTLQYLELWSESAEELLLGTAAQESRFRYVRQIGGGPALGLFQMEPATYRDIWLNWLTDQEGLCEKVVGLASRPAVDASIERSPRELIGNLPFAVAMTRCHYRRIPRPLPAAGDVEGMARYWKTYYNTALGAGRVSEYVQAWRELVGGV